ncbi:MAG TPA: glycosyl hydrolase family 79 C-terminal domain-containing protein [Sphingomicrobium sp.]|nr:glycosyl hydrolase family 79 C-terminal domain-containing protein [Sphingomicrobium sp.]
MDYMLDVGARGCTGINLHGGGGNVIAAALGDKLPGARNARDLEIAKLGTFYSPIAGNPQLGYSARPIFYGMMAVEMSAGSTLVGTELVSNGVNLTAYAGYRTDGSRIGLINKDLQRNVVVHLRLPAGMRRVFAWRLTGPAPNATEGIRFAGAEVMPDIAAWSPRPKPLTISRGEIAIGVRRSSAVVLTLS